ncbi:MAG: hypothetical protein RLZ63_484 [Pseudomonadota bacterium]
MLFVLFQLGQVLGLEHLATHAKAHIAQGLHLLKELFELAFFLACHRSQDHQLGVLWQGHHRIHHLGHGLGLQRQVVVGAVRRAGACEQQAQIVVDLGHRAHRGARVVAGGFLLDGNRGRQALDQVHIGLVHQLQKLPRISREAFHIAALAFGVQRVKSQAGLARARQPSDHHQLVARDVQVDVLEVVRARAADADAVVPGCNGQVSTLGRAQERWVGKRLVHVGGRLTKPFIIGCAAGFGQSAAGSGTIGVCF